MKKVEIEIRISLSYLTRHKQCSQLWMLDAVGICWIIICYIKLVSVLGDYELSMLIWELWFFLSLSFFGLYGDNILVNFLQVWMERESLQWQMQPRNFSIHFHCICVHYLCNLFFCLVYSVVIEIRNFAVTNLRRETLLLLLLKL